MGFRFRKSFKVAPGVRLNLGKKSASVSFGGKGFRHSISSSGRRTTSVSVPGTGLSYVSSKSSKKKKQKTSKNLSEHDHLQSMADKLQQFTDDAPAKTDAMTDKIQKFADDTSAKIDAMTDKLQKFADDASAKAESNKQQDTSSYTAPNYSDWWPKGGGKRPIVFTVLLWIVSLFFFFMTIGSLAENAAVAAILYAVGGVIVNPLFLNRKHIRKRFLIPAVIILFFGGSLALPTTENDTSAEQPATTQTEQVETADKKQLEEKPVEEEPKSTNPLLNEEVQGDTACKYIIFPKADAQKVSQKEFVQFYKEVVKVSEAESFVLDLEDNTGIVFTPGKRKATYGSIDSDRTITEEIGYITWRKNKVKYKSKADIEAEKAEKAAKKKAEEEARIEREKAEAEAAAQAERERAEQEAAEAAAAEEAAQDPVVYITNTGGKYHTGSCRTLKDSKIETTLSSAQAQGYDPCGICHPPT